MKCPKCNQDFKLTWRQYVKAPFGRFPCPLYQTRLIGQPRWFFWLLSLPLMLGSFIVAMPLSFFGLLYFSWFGCIAGSFIGCSLVILPFDKYLDNRFGVLTIDKKHASNKVESGAADKPSTSF